MAATGKGKGMIEIDLADKDLWSPREGRHCCGAKSNFTARVQNDLPTHTVRIEAAPPTERFERALTDEGCAKLRSARRPSRRSGASLTVVNSAHLLVGILAEKGGGDIGVMAARCGEVRSDEVHAYRLGPRRVDGVAT
jgi:hypothetical protein